MFSYYDDDNVRYGKSPVLVENSSRPPTLPKTGVSSLSPPPSELPSVSLDPPSVLPSRESCGKSVIPSASLDLPSVLPRRETRRETRRKSVTPPAPSDPPSVLPSRETRGKSMTPSMSSLASSILPSRDFGQPPPTTTALPTSLSLSPGEKLYIRNSRKIRGQMGSTYGWFELEDAASPLKPPSIKGAIPNDLLVNKLGSGEIRIWLWTADGDWRPINIGEQHPLLPTHYLIINNGKPRWVTRQTVATYACRVKHVCFKPEPSSIEADF